VLAPGHRSGKRDYVPSKITLKGGGCGGGTSPPGVVVVAVIVAVISDWLADSGRVGVA
jgi:hypothetical protein